MGYVMQAIGGFVDCSWDALFVTLGGSLDIEAHTLTDVNHNEAFARMLSVIGLKTLRFQWKHEANPTTDDNVESGYRRLPTTSWLLRVFSFFRLCHYIHVSEDARVIRIVAPRRVARRLIKFSSENATKEISEDAKDELCKLIYPPGYAVPQDGGGGGAAGYAIEVDTRCRRMEPYIAVFAALLAWRVLRSAFGSLEAVSMVATSGGLAMLTLSSDPCAVGIREWFLWSFCSVLVVVEGAVAFVAGSQRHEGRVYVSDIEDGRHTAGAASLSERFIPGEGAPSSEKQLSLEEFNIYVTLHSEEGRWYKSVTHHRADIEALVSTRGHVDRRQGIKFPADGKTRAYLLSLDMLPLPGNVVASIAYCTSADKCLPYIVHHNPMTDPPILAIADLLGKAQGALAEKPIFVIVLLPDIVALDLTIKHGVQCRVSHPKNSGFVASLADMSDFLMRVSNGVIHRVALVFPSALHDELAGNEVWRLCQRHLSLENCSTMTLG